MAGHSRSQRAPAMTPPTRGPTPSGRLQYHLNLFVQGNRGWGDLAIHAIKFHTFIECFSQPFSKNRVNVIIAGGKSEPRQFVACVLLATSRLDINHCVRQRMGVRRVSFASPEETQRITGMEIGGVTAFGLPQSLPLWVDHRVMKPKFIILGGCSRSIKLKISPDVIQLIDNATIVEDLASIPG